MNPTAVGAALAAAGPKGPRSCIFARARLRNWGATREEIDTFQASDDLVTGPVTTTTYAVTVFAPADVVWRWLVQITVAR